MATLSAKWTNVLLCLALLLLLLLGDADAGGEGSCEEEEGDSCRNKDEALKLRIGGIFLILAAGAVGVCIPIVGKSFSLLSAGSSGFFVVKAFAAGVILSTGMVHVLPDAFDSLGSPCLKENPWAKFPFAGFIAMMAALGTLMLETGAMSYYKRVESRRAAPPAAINGGSGADLEDNGAGGEVHVHTHASHSHAHGPHIGGAESETMRHRIISQVLELGIIVHSVIIGIAMGASESPCTIKPLMAALSFHQFFEGMGLGGCIVQASFTSTFEFRQIAQRNSIDGQARFKFSSSALMVLFFSLTTPIGIAVGIGISSTYNEGSVTTLIVQGCFNAASAGILIYMSLVDLLAADFSTPMMQSSVKLQIITNIFLLLGVGLMSLIAKWN
ncbi:zinc transporter 8-like [Nymphaea colorata]|nr:zinc transporter 8-like [Nymphaea colorata]